MMIANMGAAQISMELGLRGPLSCPTTACASGNHAIGDATDHIRAGRADVMLAGGAECAASCNEVADNCFAATTLPCTDDGAVCTDDLCNGVGACSGAGAFDEAHLGDLAVLHRHVGAPPREACAVHHDAVAHDQIELGHLQAPCACCSCTCSAERSM